VVITTRTEPVFPLASLRAQNSLLEIDAPALRFDLQETRTFLAQEKLGALAPSSVELMHRKTEGWPASLRIVASTGTEHAAKAALNEAHQKGLSKVRARILQKYFEDLEHCYQGDRESCKKANTDMSEAIRVPAGRQ